MAASHTVEANGKAFEIVLGWNAIRRIEEQLKEPLQNVGMKMIAGQSGIIELGVIFWAGLETARIKNNSRPNPWSIEEAGNLIDDIGPAVFFDQVYPQILKALGEAFPVVKEADAKAKAKEEEAKNAPRRKARKGGIGKASSPMPPNTD